MNDYNKICKGLYEAKKSGAMVLKDSNEYICAYDAVKSYVKGDMQLLRKIKSEIKSCNYASDISNYLALLAFVISSFAFYLSSLENAMGEKSLFTQIIGVGMLVFVVTCTWKFAKDIKGTAYVAHMGGYVQVAVEQLEEELLKKEQKKKDKKKKKNDRTK